MRASLIALLTGLVAAVSFFVGRGSVEAMTTTSVAPASAVTTSVSGAVAPVAANAPVAAATASGSPPGRDRDDGTAVGTPPPATVTSTVPGATAPGSPAPAATCEARLEEVQSELTALVKRREELEGKPIPARDDVAPRFASAGLLSTFQRGFAQSGVKGQVESVDCSEHPCILFGRLEGDEGEVAKLEDSAVFSAYDDDIGVMLTWASGHGGHDDGHDDEKPAAGREKPDEVSLFAFAFYGVEEEGRSEQIDRRIRTRTAEYWNASRPRE